MRTTFNLYDMLASIERDRKRLLGDDCSFQSLKSYIAGFTTAAANEAQLKARDYPSLVFFDEWLAGHLPKADPTLNWYEQIRKRNPQDDDKAFEEFFNFLNIFKASKVSTKTIYLDTVTRIKFNPELSRSRSEGLSPIEYIIILRWTAISNSSSVWVEELDEYKDVRETRYYLNEEEANEDVRSLYGNVGNLWKPELSSAEAALASS